eukprot:CAMPEP_0181189734 /NCGR_PEP_ID=MMETSP1096-20121128/11816_1 /TAXON_ID=156174 ORGANISM="Chrysochromulina ericina, Strain CCMP281" /NCGR_SAMPLE_ID=MMETSP1096 /ASSEMBLY_ACC=CAM_ASM_000453 /LENGTH=63 /DNA_ID=CAMNT_0023278899 /DNA_START=155 /DNA_END=343 /DNA_ORIENTATION=+
MASRVRSWQHLAPHTASQLGSLRVVSSEGDSQSLRERRGGSMQPIRLVRVATASVEAGETGDA